MASKIEGFFGDGNNENQDFSNIDFTVNILSIVTKNDEMEDLLSKIMKDEKFESARKAKLSNQFGSVCLKANNFEKSGQLFGQAIQLVPSDGPSALYRERCQDYIEKPPTDLIYRAHEK